MPTPEIVANEWPGGEPNWDGIPFHMRGGLARYIMDGVRPGDFLIALLSNDFMEAAGRADAENLEAFKAYATFFYCSMPSAARGSPENVRQWISHGGYNGLRK